MSLRTILVSFLLLMGVAIVSYAMLSKPDVQIGGRLPKDLQHELLLKHPVGSPRQPLERTLRRSGVDAPLAAEVVTAEIIASFTRPPLEPPFNDDRDRTFDAVPRLKVGDLLYEWRWNVLLNPNTNFIWVVIDPATDTILDIGVQ